MHRSRVQCERARKSSDSILFTLMTSKRAFSVHVTRPPKFSNDTFHSPPFKTGSALGHISLPLALRLKVGEAAASALLFRGFGGAFRRQRGILLTFATDAHPGIYFYDHDVCSTVRYTMKEYKIRQSQVASTHRATRSIVQVVNTLRWRHTILYRGVAIGRWLHILG